MNANTREAAQDTDSHTVVQGTHQPDNPAEMQILSLEIFRQLALGQPALGAVLGLSEAVIGERLQSYAPSVIDFDAAGAITGFSGLTTRETRHRFEIDGRTLYAWCAFDTMFLPEILGRAAAVRSTCPATDRLISLTIDADGVRGASPETAVISMINPSAEEARADTRGAFCGYVNYFASASAYDSWAKDHPGATFLTLEDAHAKGRERNANRYKDVPGLLRRTSAAN